MYDETKSVLDAIDFEHLSDRLEGRDGGLRTSKPRNDNGLVKYIWRTARASAGYDTSIVVKAPWHLQDWLDEEGVDASVSGILDDEGKEITYALNIVADAVLIELGEPIGEMAKRWKKAGAF